MFEEGSKCICQENDWYNAYGERSTALQRGMRLTITGSKYVGGIKFLSFKEAPEDNFFMINGFAPMRMYN